MGLIKASASYIPIEEFKEVFLSVADLVKDKSIDKLIFDKTSLQVFHQPSMEWYFVEWKSEMAKIGLVRHVKILPDDLVFSQSVKLGRQQIDEKYPDAPFHDLSIQYADTLEEALSLD
ncbi:hypothetical protein [Reichenbachiella ulvae]|uniref:Uncharacterized protein n=1 Tax=Reichenbachiella ulvae TaxID=2980104 RepID=A0ABT3CQ46_9BACT|nr:hypothetical protein [Reichenbachiella ulvae]MCV9385673.1 hypothetical protein [Reichenbachiella ulvae]